MERWPACALSLVLALGGQGCAGWTSPWRELPVPLKVAPLHKDQIQKVASLCIEAPGGDDQEAKWNCSQARSVTFMSLQDEGGYLADVVISARMWAAIEAYVERLRQGYCEGRYSLQVANGKDPEKLEVCEPRGP